MVDSSTVVGIDACKHGWIGVVLQAGLVRAMFAPQIAELATLLRTAVEIDTISCVAVDIPIGLPDRGERPADRCARKLVGPRSASVFMTPTRYAMEATTQIEASRRNRELGGRGVTAQAFSLRTKLLETERWVCDTDLTVVEVHPEVSFRILNGAPLRDPKRTWAGATTRRDLLAREGIVFEDLGDAGRRAGMDDVLDAGVAAWTARRYVEGSAISLSDPSKRFSDDLPAAIWA